MPNTANRVIKNTGYLYAKMGITMFISLYTTRLILNSLGTSDFGIFNIVGGAIAMLGFLNAAMATATQRFMSYSKGEGDKEKQRKIFNISILLHIGISGVIAMVLIIAGHIFFNGVLNIPIERIFAAKIIYSSLIVSTVLTVINVPYDAVMNAHENMKYYAIVGIIESILKLAVAITCVYTLYDKLIIYGILTACIPLMTLTIMKVYCHRKYEECIINPRIYWDKSLMKEMTSFAGWNLLSSVSAIVSQYGLNIVINYFFGVLLNAAQGIANQVSGVLTTFSSNALKALNPIIIKSEGAKDHERMIYTTLLGCRISFLIFGAFSVPFITIMPQILKFWLKNVPDWACIFCQLQLLRTLLEQLFLSLSTAIQANGKIKKVNLTTMWLNFTPLILTPIFFHFGYAPYWLYIIWIVCWSVLRGFVILYYTHKFIGLSYTYFVKSVLYPCLITFITPMSFIFWIENTTDLFMRIGIVMLQISLYLWLSWFLLIQQKEKISLLKLMKQKIN